MNFQKKLLSLAVIGAALAAPVAHAAIDIGSNGNGELIFSLWSDNGTASLANDDVSYTRDLGITLNDWSSSTNPITLSSTRTTLGYVENYFADSRLTTFLNTPTPAGTTATFRWNVAASDANGADRLLTTGEQGLIALPSQTTNTFRNVSASFNQYANANNQLANAQNSTPNSVVAVNNSNTATFSDTLAFAGGGTWNTNFGSRVTFNNSGVIGAQLPFFLQYETSTTQTGNALQQRFNSALGVGADGSAAYWTLDAIGNLSYNVAAVPEADTWAMFAAGLIAVGAIARRRLAA